MSSPSEKLAQAAWRITPAPIERKLRTEAGRRFLRFVPAALAAVVTSQIVLAILTGPVALGAFTSGVIASMSAALVSYLMSRWAWERKGRPDLLRETLPFWAVSIAVWIVLGETTHVATAWAQSMGYTHLTKHVVVQGAYLLMNCVTFVLRFLIFHYLLFADRKPVAPLDPVEVVAAEHLSTAETSANGSDTGPMALISGDSGPPGR
jgi:putative flippase GtrA